MEENQLSQTTDLKKSTQEIPMENSTSNDFLNSNIGVSVNQKIHVLRLLPNSDLYESLLQYINKNVISAASVLSCVGSLEKLHIRTANLNFIVKNEHLEIVSLVGNLGLNRNHLHISVSDGEGRCIGGHLMKEGNIVHTTVEISLIEYNDLLFLSKYDETTKFNELIISKQSIIK